MPVYDLRTSRVTGTRQLSLGQHSHLVAEGIFAAEVAPHVRERELLASAVCARHRRLGAYVLRLMRDLREHRRLRTCWCGAAGG